MAEKETVTKAPVELSPEADAIINKAKGFWAKYSKKIIYVGSAIILLVGGYIAYKYFYKLPRIEKAKDAIYPADRLFMKMDNDHNFPADSAKILLSGGTLPDGQKVTGLLKIISEYGGNAVGNRAKYMAGTTYLMTKDFDNTIKQLKDFDGSESYIMQSNAYYMLAHAYADKQNKEEALSNFKKAASVNEKDDALTPKQLLVAANYADYIGKSADAIDLLKKLKANYGASSQAAEADKLLAKLGVLE